jgi:JmjC domain, hydroxylase/Zinc-finger domain of monoamine-oxidase A repressor R1
MTIGHYLRSMGQLTKQFTASNYRDPKRQRLYLKDIDCPDAWGDHLKETIPECVFYLNDCIESQTGGDGAIREPNKYGQMQYGKGVAPAGDLMVSLPPEMRAQNMMCYVGHEGTYTAAHREMCASLGHNIMIEASEDGNGEKAGSSIWFMTETKEREVVSEYFLSMLGHDIEIEKHFAQVNAWKKAPFNVWVVDQRVGDLIIIPPLAPHQVWNRGTRTIKAAWNRTTVDTLELAIHEALPRARMVCRDEQYKCKAIIYYTLVNYYDLLQRDTIEPKMWKYGRIKQLLEDFKRLFSLYQEVLVSEMFSPKLPKEESVEMLPYDSNVTCSYCRCNIFNRFLTCKACIQYGPNGEEDTYDVCMDCYAMGRSCACISNLSWVEQWEWNILATNYEVWRTVVVQFDRYFDTMRSPQPLDIARKRSGKKPIAEVCQEQLKLRPFTDITKPKELTPEMSDVEPDVDDEGRLRKRKGRKKPKQWKPGRGRVEPAKGKTQACHICCHHDYKWKLAFCTTCNLAYCYGTLWRAFDLMPQTVMEDKEWQCPRCLKICSCGKCRKDERQNPYQPKGTLLGHDTRKVADYRSVESLVDFSKTNLGWLRDGNADNPHESGRMKKLKEKAEAEKARDDVVEESFLDDDTLQEPFTGAALDENAHSMADIDPELRDTAPFSAFTNGNGHYHTSYDLLDPGANGDDINIANRFDEYANLWVDGHYNLDDYDSCNQQPTNYPSRLLAPVTPMLAPEQLYPDPSNIGQNRMMGIGYYQQGNGVDQILYDPPNSNDSVDDLSQPMAQRQTPNMALSDLLAPALQPPLETGKKRKKTVEIVTVDEDEDDLEFFTSKRQKMRAEKQEAKQDNINEVTSGLKADKRPPRRSTGKPKTYIDLGQDAATTEEDEGSLQPSHMRKEEDGDSSLKVAAEARSPSRKLMPRQNKPAPAKGRTMQAPPSNRSESPSGASNTIKIPRNSAWLARKKDEEAGVPSRKEMPKRTRRKRAYTATYETKSSTAVEISSGSEDGEVRNDGDVDELSVEQQERPKNDRRVTSRPFAVNTNVMFAKPRSTSINQDNEQPVSKVVAKVVQTSTQSSLRQLEKPVAKRRGRPPKNAKAVPPLDLESPSPQPTRSATVPKLLSLKEKLALNGKSFRIVAKMGPELAASTSASLSASTTPSIPRPILMSPSIASPVGWSSGNGKPNPAGDGYARTRANSSHDKNGSFASPAAPPAKRLPTIVRLVSPDSESEGSGEELSKDDVSSESDSNDSPDDSDASIHALRVSGGRRGMTPKRGRPVAFKGNE